MKIYTRQGDDGHTSLPGGRRVYKNHVRLEACGAIDELIAWTGLLRDCNETGSHRDRLLNIQSLLMACAAAVADEKGYSSYEKYMPTDESVLSLENEIDEMEAELKPLSSFILPGGHKVISYCNITRCVCRRAERAVVSLNQSYKIPEIVPKFINRLSDYYFVLMRYLALRLDIEDVKWPLR